MNGRCNTNLENGESQGPRLQIIVMILVGRSVAQRLRSTSLLLVQTVCVRFLRRSVIVNAFSCRPKSQFFNSSSLKPGLRRVYAGFLLFYCCCSIPRDYLPLVVVSSRPLRGFPVSQPSHSFYTSLAGCCFMHCRIITLTPCWACERSLSSCNFRSPRKFVYI
ncbi:uncharacterized protein EV420DRAFT_518192 [Desarmillaria tabescens]|uniref:Uncharacterized protein n=1 Tax=Armillaria tabescens TaxID=1929756 RepID=A0AA39KCF8_ARMTA|nr:uncharacterized protein EV420DRAFT_518192 [Desarmillaria tabescens]KAK0457301.1 hypothetical protein EV420DRAFT_518192 [Desarmillaria tabescens]